MARFSQCLYYMISFSILYSILHTRSHTWFHTQFHTQSHTLYWIPYSVLDSILNTGFHTPYTFTFFYVKNYWFCQKTNKKKLFMYIALDLILQWTSSQRRFSAKGIVAIEIHETRSMLPDLCVCMYGSCEPIK